MGKKASSSDSSSEDENLAKFREVAVSFETIKESNENQTSKNGSNKKMSNRCVDQVDENDEDDPNNMLKVTPEFQHFVATKLSHKLDSLIELVESPLSSKNEKETEGDEKGFKLMKGIYLMQNEIDNSSKPLEAPKKRTKKKKKNKRKESSSDSSSGSDMEMLKEAAIDSSEIFKTTSIVEHQKRFGSV